MQMQFIIVWISTWWVGSRKQKSATWIRLTNLHPTGYHQVCKWNKHIQRRCQITIQTKKGGKWRILHHTQIWQHSTTLCCYPAGRHLCRPEGPASTVWNPSSTSSSQGSTSPGCPCTTHTPQREPKDRTNLSPIPHRPAPARAGLTTRTKFGGKNTAVTTSTTERTNPQQNWWIGASIPARTIGINESHTERILQSFT